MKRFSAGLILSLLAVTAFAQQQKDDKTLLWKISGNGLEKPSYLFGTIHMLCKEDAFLSPQLKSAIADADKVYLELDMDNMLELLGAMMRMKMKNDTTLADLLTKDEYNRIKEYFQEHSTLLPFSVVETYKPMLAASMIMETTMVCEDQVAMEQLIMEEAKNAGKSIEGLETMAYQMSMFDSIPYKVQAKALLKGISSGKDETAADKEFQALLKAYKEQDLEKLGKMISQSEDEMMQYDDLLLNNRNRNWVEKLKKLMPLKSLMVAVGAGHLPGDKGVIALLRLAGYTVTPMENKVGNLHEPSEGEVYG